MGERRHVRRRAAPRRRLGDAGRSRPSRCHRGRPRLRLHNRRRRAGRHDRARPARRDGACRGWIVADDVEPEHARAPRGARGRLRGPAARRRRAERVDRAPLGRPARRGPPLRVSPPNLVPPNLRLDGLTALSRRKRPNGGAVAAAARPAGVGRVDVRGGGLDDRVRRRRGRARARSRRTSSQQGRDGRGAALVPTPTPSARAAWRRAAAGECVVVGGRIAALAPGARPARRGRRRRRRRGAAGGARADVARARRAVHERARRVGCAVHRVLAGADRRGVARRSGVLDAPAPDVEHRGWPRVRVVDRGDEPPGAGLLTEPLADALRNARRPSRCASSTGAAASACSLPASASTCCGGSPTRTGRRCAPSAASAKPRLLRAGVTRVREELEALVPGARVVDVDAATGDVPDADIAIGTEAVLHRASVRRRRPDARRVPRSRSGAARAALPRRVASALARDARRAAARAAARVRDAARLADAHSRPRRRASRRARRSGARRGQPSAEYRRTLGYPPFGALAELKGEEVPLAATIDALRARSTARAGLRTRRRPGAGPRSGLGCARRRACTSRSRSAAPSAAFAPRSIHRACRQLAAARGTDLGAIGTMGAMATHTIRVFGDPVLKRPTAPVTDIDGALVKLVDAMYETMYDAPGVGPRGVAGRRAEALLRLRRQRRDRPARHLQSRDRRDERRVDLRRGLPLAARPRASRSCGPSSSRSRASTSTATRS